MFRSYIFFGLKWFDKGPMKLIFHANEKKYFNPDQAVKYHLGMIISKNDQSDFKEQNISFASLDIFSQCFSPQNSALIDLRSVSKIGLAQKIFNSWKIQNCTILQKFIDQDVKLGFLQGLRNRQRKKLQCTFHTGLKLLETISILISMSWRWS